MLIPNPTKTRSPPSHNWPNHRSWLNPTQNSKPFSNPPTRITHTQNPHPNYTPQNRPNRAMEKRTKKTHQSKLETTPQPESRECNPQRDATPTRNSPAALRLRFAKSNAVTSGPIEGDPTSDRPQAMLSPWNSDTRRMENEWGWRREGEESDQGDGEGEGSVMAGWLACWPFAASKVTWRKTG